MVMRYKTQYKYQNEDTLTVEMLPNTKMFLISHTHFTEWAMHPA